MKYKLSALKHRLNSAGVYQTTLRSGEGWTNRVEITALQRIVWAEVKHLVYALTYEEAISCLVERAEAFKDAVERIKAPHYDVPDYGNRNLFGHLKDGNVEFIDDIIPATEASK